MGASKEIDPEKFRQLQEFSKDAHFQRLPALYVDVSSGNQNLATPKEAVTVEEAVSLLEIVKQNLQQLEIKSSPDVEAPDELSQWFWDVVADEHKQKRLFSASFLGKYVELEGNARNWIRWAKEEFEKISQEEQALLAAEMSRVVDENAEPNERWRLKMRIYCISHTVRQKMLNFWNESVPLAKLQFVNNSEMLLELTLGDQNKAQDVPAVGQSFSKLFLAALNIGTAGYFWHELPKTSAEYFEKIEDLENPQYKMQAAGGYNLQRHWLTGENGRRLTVLEEKYLNNAAICAVVFARDERRRCQVDFWTISTGLSAVRKK